MNLLKKLTLGILALTISSALYAQKLTIFWAEWDPANQLQELAEMYTEETGVDVVVETTPWPDFQTKTFTEFAAKGSSFDMVVGDSQWVGAGVKGGHYVKLNDFFKEHKVAETMTAGTVAAYAEYPQGSKNYYAIPTEGDADGWAYRKDWFEDPKEMANFQKKYGYKLDVPETWAQLKDIAEFFHRPDEGRYGVTVYTGKGYDALTMGIENVIFAFGGSLGDYATYKVEGLVNSKETIAAVEYYKELYQFTPPDWGDTFFAEANQVFTQGKVAMSMNYFAFFPALTNKKVNPHVAGTGYFSNPKGPAGRFAALGGQGMSINSYISDSQKKLSYDFLAWFVKEENQRKWAEVGGFTCNKAVLESEAFLNATPFNAAFKETMFMVKDFWAIPEFADLLEPIQRNMHQYIVADQGTAKEGLDNVAREWKEILKKAGYTN
ncbi:MAG: extracellular solute-binding protein [SAR324 cluster bacterium]|nr:extracellular solute-binding protein [SAR324 cluster bacterium]